MKRKRTLVRAVALFMVGLITALALVIPTSAIVSQYMDDRNNPSTRCPIPFDVRFWYEQSDEEDSLYFGYDVPIGYGSTEHNLISGGLDSAEGKKFNENTLVIETEGFRANYNVGAPTYIDYMTAWGESIDWWGYIPVELNAQAIDRTNFDGIAIDAPTFYYNVWESTFYQDTTEGVKLFSMPTIQLPVLDDGKVYVGRYNVSCGIYDTNGEFRNVEYSIAIDQRENNDPIPFLNSGIFEQYLTKTEDDFVNNYIVAIDGFQAFIDVDVYEYVEPETSDELVGTWVFNNSITEPDFSVSYVHFDSNGHSFDTLFNNNNHDCLSYAINGVSDGEIDVFVFGGIGWLNDIYKTITITSKLSEVTNGDTLLTWLKVNATKQGSTATVAEEGTWELVADSLDKCTRLIVTYPIHKQVGASIGGGSSIDIMNRYSYPDWHKYDDSRSHTISTDLEVDFTGWIATATSGFLNFELFPNFSIGGVLAILVGFSLVILFLKVFAGG